MKSSSIDLSIRAPYDPNDPRFIASFHLNDDPTAILHFYQQYGFVVFDEIMNEEEIERSIEELWRCYPGVDRNDPNTWEYAHSNHGFAGKGPFVGRQLWENRAHPNIVQAFKLLYELTSQKQLNEPLVACLDRGSLMLPTEGPHGREEWKAKRIPHFDLNPFLWTGVGIPVEAYQGRKAKYNDFSFLMSEGNNLVRHGYPKLRAVLQLSESTAETGGFECTVGLHRQLSEWCELSQKELNKMYDSAYGIGLPLDHPLVQNMQKITVRKGSLIVFTAELPHTMFPNESSQFRYAQYFRMTPLSTLELDEEQYEKRQKLMREYFPGEVKVTDLMKEVFLL